MISKNKKKLNNNKKKELVITIRVVPFFPKKKPKLKVNILEKKGKKTSNRYIKYYGVWGW